MRELLINQNEDIALLEDGELVEYREYENNGTPMTGDVYVARVTDFLPGNPDACFLDIGGGMTGFCSDRKGMKQGETGIFQVEVAPRGSKQTRLSKGVRLRAPFLICKMSYDAPGVGVSSKIKSIALKKQMKELGEELLDEFGSITGLVMRTRFTEEEFEYSELRARREAESINKLFESFARAEKNPGRIHKVSPTVEILSTYPRIESIIVESEKIYKDCLEGNPRVRYVPVGQNGFSIFDKKNVTGMVSQLFGRKVYLKSGANIMIDMTEALTVIDVNSGKATGKNAEIEKVNLEAVREIMRQLRLRNIGGAIVCDMIGTTEENRQEMLKLANELAEKDIVKVKIHGFTELGLLEISRKRT